MRSKIVLSLLLLPCCAGALLLGAVRCSTAPPTVLDLVLQERQRYEQLFGLELAVCAGATPLDGLLWRGGAGAETALDRCSSVRRGFAQICEASTAAGLVEAVRQAGVACETPWTVEHVPLWSTLRAGARRDDHWRFSGLALALAQTVAGPPALLGASAAPDSCVRFGVLEGETLRFGVLRKGVRGAGAADRDAHWAARPFKFSGALDAEVSRAIVNIVVDSRSDATPPPRLFDPCCGSGTNLWAAACRGGSVAGSDRDATKADGCRRNLAHAGVALESVGVRDASRDALPAASDADCAVLNLPWGEKVRQTHGENDRILANVAACVEIKFYGAFELILRANLHAIDAPPARWRDDAGSLPLDGARAPDTLVDFHTGRGASAVGHARGLSGHGWRRPRLGTRRLRGGTSGGRDPRHDQAREGVVRRRRDLLFVKSEVVVYDGLTRFATYTSSKPWCFSGTPSPAKPSFL